MPDPFNGDASETVGAATSEAVVAKVLSVDVEIFPAESADTTT
jgi:hypothetical protein